MMARLLRSTMGMALFLALGTGAPRPAAASVEEPHATPVRVVLLGRPNASALTRMRAELETLGWQVFAPRRRMNSDGPGTTDGAEARAPSRGELEGTAREFHANALVEIDDDGALHVWVIDAAGHVQPVEVVHTATEDVTTLRSAEIVRVAVEYRLHSPSPAPGARASEPDRAQPSAPAAPNKFTVTGGLSFLAMPYGGIRPGWDLRLGARYDFKPRVGIAAFVGIPVMPNTWEPRPASTDIRAWLAGIGPVFTWESKEQMWSVHAGGGVAGAALEFSGGGQKSGTHGVTRKGPVVLPFLELAAGLRLFSSTRLTLGALLAHALPRTAVYLAGPEDNSAVWGQPLAMISLTLDASF